MDPAITFALGSVTNCNEQAVFVNTVEEGQPSPRRPRTPVDLLPAGERIPNGHVALKFRECARPRPARKIDLRGERPDHRREPDEQRRDDAAAHGDERVDESHCCGRKRHPRRQCAEVVQPPKRESNHRERGGNRRDAGLSGGMPQARPKRQQEAPPTTAMTQSMGNMLVPCRAIVPVNSRT